MAKHQNHNQQTQQNKGKVPGIGLRTIKTALSTTLCAVIYILIGRNPTFACIGAVFGMDTLGQSPWRTGGNRLAGTVIGGFLGMGLFYVQQNIPGKAAQIFLLFAGIVLLIYISQRLGCPGAIQGGSVVFYIVMLNTPQDQYISYAINRMVDTAVGVVTSVAINVLLFWNGHAEQEQQPESTPSV